MSKSRTRASEFDSDLKDILPRLRVYALALTHDRDRADDLVQQTAVKALVGRKSFRPGTNFGGWLFRIQRNEFISGLRRLRPTVCFDDISTNTLPIRPTRRAAWSCASSWAPSAAWRPALARLSCSRRSRAIRTSRSPTRGNVGVTASRAVHALPMLRAGFDARAAGPQPSPSPSWASTI